jgi:hypothetical protein
VHHISNAHKAFAVQVGGAAGRRGARTLGMLAGLNVRVECFNTTSSSSPTQCPGEVESDAEAPAGSPSVYIPRQRGRPQHSASALLTVAQMESRGFSHTHLDGFRSMSEDTVPSRKHVSQRGHTSVEASVATFGTRKTPHGRAVDLGKLLYHVLRRSFREFPAEADGAGASDCRRVRVKLTLDARTN